MRLPVFLLFVWSAAFGAWVVALGIGLWMHFAHPDFALLPLGAFALLLTGVLVWTMQAK